MADGTVKIDTELDSKGLNSDLKGLDSKLGGLASKGFAVFTGAATAAAAALGAAAVAGVSYNAKMEDYFANFETMLGGAEEATALVNELKEMGAKTPFEMGDLADASKTLLAFGEDAADLKGDLQMLGDISLGNAEKFSGLATVFGQVKSAGKMTGQDLMQMINQGFNPLQVISDKTGESMESLRDKMAEGQISFEMVSDAMKTATSEGGQFYGAMEKSSQTFNGMVSTLKDNAMSLVGEVMAPLSAAATTTLLPAATSAISTLTEAFKTNGVAGLLGAGMGMLKNVLDGVTAALPTLGPAVMQVLANLVQKFVDSMPTIFNTGWDLLLGLVDGIVNAIPVLINQLPKIIAGLVRYFVECGPQLLENGALLLIKIAGGIISAIPQLIGKLPEIFSSIIKTFKDVDWGKVGGDILDGIGAGIAAQVTKVVKSAKEAAGKVVDGIKDFLGIHSPSTLMRDEVGKYMMAGIGVGADDATPRLITGVKGNVSKLVDGMKAEVSSIGMSANVSGSMAEAMTGGGSSGKSLTANDIAAATINALRSSGFGISVNGREFGRIVGEYI